MAKRFISGLVILSVLAIIVIVNLFFPFGMNIAIGIVTAFMVYELCEVYKMEKTWYYMIPSMCFGIGMPLIENHYWASACCALYLFVIGGFMLFNHEKVDFKSYSSITALIMLIAIAMRTLVGVRDLGGAHGAFYVFITIMASWVADAGAYFAGSFFGKHKLCPKLSPKKTIEGVFGGFFLNLLGTLVFGTFYNLIFYGFSLRISYLSLIVIGLSCTVISIMGDLVFSFIKRSFGIKDYGHIIPGHGGFLDRFDSVIFVSPFLFFLLQLLPIVK